MKKRIHLITTAGMGCLGKSRNTRLIVEMMLKQSDNHFGMVGECAAFLPFSPKTLRECADKGVYGRGIVVIGSFKNVGDTIYYKSGNDNLKITRYKERQSLFSEVVKCLVKEELEPMALLNEGYFNMQSEKFFDKGEWDDIFDTMCIHLGNYPSFDVFNSHQSKHRKQSHINGNVNMESRKKTYDSHNTSYNSRYAELLEKQKNSPDDYQVLKRIPFLYPHNYIMETLYEISGLSIFSNFKDVDNGISGLE